METKLKNFDRFPVFPGPRSDLALAAIQTSDVDVAQYLLQGEVVKIYGHLSSTGVVT